MAADVRASVEDAHEDAVLSGDGQPSTSESAPVDGQCPKYVEANFHRTDVRRVTTV